MLQNAAWVKVAEKESMDIVLDWDNFTECPRGAEDLSDQNGKLRYKGAANRISAAPAARPAKYLPKNQTPM